MSEAPEAGRPAPPALRTGTKLCYGVGQTAEGIKNASFAAFLLFFYSQVLGLSATLAGTALLIALVFDAVTDPLVGSLSDSLRTRWGRRHPFLYASALPLGVTFAFVFAPPAGLGQGALFAWLLGWTLLTRGAMTLFHVPHLALGAELSQDYSERTVVVGYRVFFGFMGAALLFALSGEIFFRPTTAFPENGQLDPAAYPGMALFFGAVMAFVILVSAVGTHARIPYLHRHAGAEPFSAQRLVGEMAGALRIRSFRYFFLAVVAFLVSRGLADALGLYMGTYFWRLETEHIFRIVVLSLCGVVAGTPIWANLSRRYEKRTLFLAGCLTYGSLTGLAPVLKIAGWFPDPESSVYLPILYGVSFLASLCSAGAVLVPGSMLADLADLHELDSGKRQEGIFFGAISFSGKAAAGLGGWLAGMALDAIRFPLQEAPAAAPLAPVLKLGVIAGPGVMLVGLVGVVLASFYDLDRRRHAAVRAALDERRR